MTRKLALFLLAILLAFVIFSITALTAPDTVKVEGGLISGTTTDGVRSYKALTPYGHIGDPTLAAEETGNKGYDVIVEWLSMVIKRDFFDESAAR